MKSLLVLASLLSFATTAHAISIEDYYDFTGSSFTPEQKIIAQQDIKLVHFLDSVLPAGERANDDIFEDVKGLDTDGNPCVLSRIINKSEMMYRYDRKEGYRFSWDANQMTNILGNPIKTDFSLTSNIVEAAATIPLGYGLARHGLKLKVLKDKSVSISIRNRNSLLASYKTCVFKQ